MANNEALADLFKSFDVDSKGYISKDDFIEAVDLLNGDVGVGINDTHFDSFDENSGDKISLQEFIVFCEVLD